MSTSAVHGIVPPKPLMNLETSLSYASEVDGRSRIGVASFVGAVRSCR